MAGTNIVYELVTPERYQEALGLFNNYFLPYNPVLIPVQCTQQVDLMDQKVLTLLKEGLTWCAIDKDTGKMVGVRITGSEKLQDLPKDMQTPSELIAEGWTRNWAAIWILLYKAMDTRQLLNDYQEDKILELFALCVHPDYKKRNIGTKLVEHTLEYGKTRGFTFAGVICTNAYAQRLFEKLEFTRVKELLYAEYVDDVTNTVLFRDVEEPHVSTASYVKKLV